MRLLRVVATVVLLISSLGAQRPAFDAASVKRRTDPGGGFLGRRPGGRFVAEGASLQQLIEFAYRMQRDQIAGGPGWLGSERWDVNATGGPVEPKDVLAALQQLLADRFSLVVHRETRELQVYALVPARKDGTPGPQLKRSTVDCPALQADAMRTGVVPPEARGRCSAQGRVGSIQIGGAPLAELALMLSERLDRMVVDRTGLTGPWDVTLTYTPESSQIARGALAPGDQPNITPDGPSIFTAVQEQLGLKIESTRAPVDVLVIDRAELARDN